MARHQLCIIIIIIIIVLVRTHIVDDQSKASALEQWLDATKSVEPIGVASHIQKNYEKSGPE